MRKIGFVRLLPRIGYWVVFIAPFAIFLGYCYVYATNVPYYDDYDLVLGNLRAFLVSPSWLGKLSIFYTQFNEHRLLFDKLVILLQYLLTGRVNFRGLILLGDIGWVLVVLLLCYQLRKSGLSGLQILPAPYLLLAMTHYGSMLFATPALQFYWSTLFTLLFFESLVLTRKIWIPCLIAALAVFTIGSGLFILPIGAALLALRKRWRDLAIFLAVSVLLVGAYFYHYHAVVNTPGFRYSLRHVGDTIRYFLAFLGNFTLTESVAVPVGVLIAILLLVFITSHLEEPRLVPLSAWILLLAFLNAVSRSGLGTRQALAPRYTIYALMGLVCAYAWLAKWAAARVPSSAGVYSMTALLMSAGFFAAVLVEYQTQNVFTADRDARISSIAAFAASGQVSYLMYPSQAAAAKTLTNAASQGIYQYKLTARQLQRPVQRLNSLPVANSKFQGSVDSNDGIRMKGWSFIPGQGTETSAAFILLRNGNTTFELPTSKIERPDVPSKYGAAFLYYYSGYDVYLGAYAVPPGTYEVGVMVKSGASTAIHWEAASTAIH